MQHLIGRRAFVQSIAAAAGASAVVPTFQSAAGAQATYEWGVPVLDTHFHPRATAEQNITHMDGAGITKAVLLTVLAAAELRAKEAVAAYPSRLIRFAAIDATQPNA